MAKNDKSTPTTPATGPAEAKDAPATSDGRGRKVMLKNGEARVDYIRKRYYDDGIKRGPIAREITEMEGKEVAYQIVFAATKETTKPVPKAPGRPPSEAVATGSTGPSGTEEAT